MVDLESLSEKEQIELLQLLEGEESDRKANLYKTIFNSFYPWQKDFADGTARYHESCLCAGNQIGKCSSGITKIEVEEGAKSIASLFGFSHKAVTHPDNGLRDIVGWVIKKPEECYRITLDDGSWCEVPSGHRILVDNHYLSVEEILRSLPESVFCLPPSTSALGRLAHAVGAPRLMGKAVDLMQRCLVGYRLCGVQPRHVTDNVVIYPPSQGDALPHSARLLRLGAQVCKGIGNLFGKLRRPSNLGGVRRFLAQTVSHVSPSCAYAAQWWMGDNQNVPQFSKFAGHFQSCRGSSRCKCGSSSCSYTSRVPSDAVNRIVSVYSVGRKWLYDMEVADRHNYKAGGLVHHNTYTGTTIDALHLLGDYPDDYKGHRFDFPPSCWGLGYSMEKTRDLLQTAIFGKYVNGGFEGGLVPKEKILSWESATGTPNAMRSVTVEHVRGSSVIQFWSYSQGQHAIMGDVVDWVHIDEEPKDQTIRPQVLTRTINGDKGRGGRVIYTFTPENGRTDLVIKFKDDPSPSQRYMQKGWDDAPHITPEKAKMMLEAFPEHQRDMRTKGEPMLGHGRIYDLSDEFILCDPFEIPDHWYVIGGMDFGWDHPQAHIKLVEDRDNGVFYLVNTWKGSKLSANDAWGAIKSWQNNIPIAWPHDGLQNEKGRDDAVQQKTHYQNAGFRMLPEMATWPPVNGKSGGNSVEHGLYELNDLMRKGKFKVFRGQPDFMDELRQYHRNDAGKIVKVRDDLLDGVRYAYMMRRFAVRVGDLSQSARQQTYIPRPVKTVGRR